MLEDDSVRDGFCHYVMEAMGDSVREGFCH